MFKGSMVALVTPFNQEKIDEEKIKNLVNFHLENKTDGIVPCGTTGESPTLSFEEHERVIEIVVQAVNKKIPVIAGTGGNNTKEAITLTKFAKKIGCDGALIVVPYYNKPTQKGLYEHYKKIAEEVDIPIILYNIPGRTGINMIPETVAKLSQIKNIVGIKEASGSISQVAEVISICPKNFVVFSGDDNMTLPLLALGGKGVISVVANIIPQEIHDMIENWEKGNIQKAQEIFYKFLPLCNSMFFETNPIPVKTAMFLMKKISDEIRLPLCKMETENITKLENVLKKYNLI
ncbi:MAG: 4-hydroxy-tetrahydrodipicolinate synthase [bacterium]